MQVTSAIILVPSKELCKQVIKNLQQLTPLCKREVRYLDLSLQVPFEAQKALIADSPEIIVSTPLKFLAHTKNNTLMNSLQYMVIDEADLMFAYEHVKELKVILR